MHSVNKWPFPLDFNSCISMQLLRIHSQVFALIILLILWTPSLPYGQANLYGVFNVESVKNIAGYIEVNIVMYIIYRNITGVYTVIGLGSAGWDWGNKDWHEQLTSWCRVRCCFSLNPKQCMDTHDLNTSTPYRIDPCKLITSIDSCPSMHVTL